MVKVSIHPTAQEITVRNNEPNAFFDAFSYEGSNLQEKTLGSLFVVGHVKYGEENLGYLVNLISSLAKREYYTTSLSSAERTPRLAFEATLKKLNEVLEDFFKNKQFKLSVGLAAVAGENLLISRIGNIKFSLARDGEYIDVLNNIELFDKEHIEEKEFSNVISGKVQVSDKLFMYLPLKTVTSREKTLKELFKKEGQAVFTQKLNDLSQTAVNFACCGIHIELNSLKEIPIQSRPSYYSPAKSKNTHSIATRLTGTINDSGAKAETQASTADLDDIGEDTRKDLKGYNKLPQPHIIPADVSLVRRKNIVASLTGFLGNVNPGPFIKKGHGRSNLIVYTVIGLVIVAGFGYFFFIRSGDSVTIKEAKANLESAQQLVDQNNFRSARTLIYSSLSALAVEQTDSAVKIRGNFNNLLNSIDKTNDKIPTLLWDLSKNESNPSTQIRKFNNILAGDDGLFVLDAEGNFNNIDSTGGLKILAKLNITSANFVFDGSKDALLLNTDAHGAIINKTSGKSSAYNLDGTTGIKNGTVYQDNLYTIENGSIIKYIDAALGKSKGGIWSKDTIDDAGAITADGNVYILTSTGKLLVYFTGEKKNEFDLALTPSNDSDLFTLKNLPFIYLIDKSNKRIMVFDKADGTLKTTYSLANVGAILSISITKDQAIYILSDDNKIWQIK